MFTHVLPPGLTARIWDGILVEGDTWVWRVSAALLTSLKDIILSDTLDFGAVVSVLSNPSVLRDRPELVRERTQTTLGADATRSMVLELDDDGSGDEDEEGQTRHCRRAFADAAADGVSDLSKGTGAAAAARRHDLDAPSSAATSEAGVAATETEVDAQEAPAASSAGGESATPSRRGSLESSATALSSTRQKHVVASEAATREAVQRLLDAIPASNDPLGEERVVALIMRCGWRDDLFEQFTAEEEATARRRRRSFSSSSSSLLSRPGAGAASRSAGRGESRDIGDVLMLNRGKPPPNDRWRPVRRAAATKQVTATDGEAAAGWFSWLR